MMFRRSALTLVAALGFVLGWMPGGQGSSAQAAGPATSVERPGGSQAATKPKPATVTAPPSQAPAPAPAIKPGAGNPVAVIATSFGDITIELYKERAPVSVANFLEYAGERFYDGTIFHRVVPGFMIQGGGLTPSLDEKTTRAPIQNEATNGLRNMRGTVAMARKQSLRSATSQFYINVADNRMLDHVSYSPGEFGYAVFGRVLAGMDVVDRIAAVRTGFAGGMDDVPVEPVVITSVTIKP
jgi:cyclophilin family peptidyl-prolyl cis-trans isomerase